MTDKHAVPTGTVTMLFTDIEGSTRLLKQLGDRYGELLADHRRLLREAFAANGGREMDTQGDAFFVAFPRARKAVEAAVESQRSLAAHEWPEGVECRVRMGLHTGEPAVGDEGYHGIGLHRGARIAGAAHGGQILLSNSTRELIEDELPAGVTIRDLGEQQLKDIDRPERIYQLVVEGLPSEFPPVRAQPRKVVTSHRRGRWAASGVVAVVALGLALVLVLGRSSSALGQIDANSVGAIDAGNNRLVSEARVGSGPGGVTSGGDSIWVANVFDDSVSRIDPKTASVQDVIPVDLDPTALAYGQGSLWVACSGTRKLLWINPRRTRSSKRVPVGNGPSGVAISPGAVWVTNRFDDTVTEIDSTTGQVEHTFDAGPSPSDIAYGFGALWITNESSATVTRLDPRHRRRPDGRRRQRPRRGGRGPGRRLGRERSRRHRLSDRSELPTSSGRRSRSGSGPRPCSPTKGRSGLPTATRARSRASTPATNRVVKVIAVGNGPQSLAAADGTRLGERTRGFRRPPRAARSGSTSRPI